MTTQEISPSFASIIPYVDGGLTELVRPKTIVEFNEILNRSILDLGKALHTEFSGLNLRGIKTHEVRIHRNGSSGNNAPIIEGGITLDRNTDAIITDIASSEVENSGSTLKMFFKQLELGPEDITKGIIVLRDTNEDILQSNCYYDLAFLIKENALKEGKSGIFLSSVGHVRLLPERKNAGRTDVGEFRSELEKQNFELFARLGYSSPSAILHPLVVRGIVEAGLLIGKAVVNRKINSGVF